jgi:hypothetical protein
MGRKKCEDVNSILSHRMRIRISPKTLTRLEELLSKSNCRSIAELVRRIVSSEKIEVIHRDMSLQEHIHQLAGIRSELRAIGVNVNQITHAFHSSDSDHQKMFHALKVGEEYAKVSEKVAVLVQMVDELGRKWLQR